MPNILFFTRHAPKPDGGGGFHRTYQIFYELISFFGKENVSLPALHPDIKKSHKYSSYIRAIRKRLRILRPVLQRGFSNKLLFNQIIENNQSGFNLFPQISLDLYKDYHNKHGDPLLCIMDNPRFLPIIKFNKENRIPTIYCPQNFDSFDLNAHLLDQFKYCKQCGISLIYELQAVTKSKHQLVISKFEEELYKGLGVNTRYYPYLPVGKIRQRLINIRSKRMGKAFDPSLFFLIGSVNHTTTYESFKWFIKNCQQYGLPSDIQVVVAGRRSDKLGEEFPPIQGVEFLGQLEQDVLEDYLEKARAILIPQLSGFGAVTRIPEMACAGIPMIVSRHAMNAMPEPPGCFIVGNDWSEWVEMIQYLKEHRVTRSLTEYKTWEAEQPKPLIEIVKKYTDHLKDF